MARKKLSEFTAKTLLFNQFNVVYTGVSIVIKDPGKILNQVQDDIKTLDSDKLYVVKVDEGVKGRMKKGLVALKVLPKDIPEKVAELAAKGYTRFLAEEFVPHESTSERYFSLERTREGITAYYAAIGGIDIEQNQDKVKKDVVTEKNRSSIAKTLGLSEDVFVSILNFFDEQFASFMEVNPLVVERGEYHILDLALEVDSTAEFFLPAARLPDGQGKQRPQDSWKATDFVGEFGGQTQEEKNIIELKAKSQAAFKFDLLNSNGSIWVLLSGGGASIVLADEVYNVGLGEDLANYGEYSGNPNQEETYIYTKNVLHLLLKSQAKKKVIIIGGGVANFTDVKATFKGLIRAMDEVKKELSQQSVKVFVRRGGPNQKAGLALMKKFLQEAGLFGNVVGPDVMITSIIQEAVKYLE